MTRIYMLDNLDSFTYNLVDEFKRLNYDLVIYRNNIDADFIFNEMQQHDGAVILVLSPGPGAPSDAGCLMNLIALCQGVYPILGICLGHQALIQHYGGRIVRADDIVHGKASLIEHCGSGPFANLPSPLPVARYHSLVADNMPEQLTTLASYNKLIMAVANHDDAVLGLQFHPESMLTSKGSQLLQQCLHYLETSAVALPTSKTTMPTNKERH